MQNTVFIQNNAGSRLGIQQQPGRSKETQESFSESLKSSTNEGVIDVYERSENNTAVPNERSGVDRRASVRRRRSSDQLFPLTSGNTATVDAYSTKQTYIKAENITSTSLSLSQKKGSLLDTWV